MHRACTHGTEDMGFLLSLTFHGDLDLVGPWDMTGKLGDREAAISEAWALPQLFTLGYLDLFGFIWGWKENSLEITLFPLRFSLGWGRVGS